jgi:anti-sigma regulatory factor (Ser/Thr protein kinase)
MAHCTDVATYRHEALFYAGHDEFVQGTLPVITEAVEAQEPILVVLNAAKIAALCAELDGHADGVLFADMAEVGANPARIIPAWQEFIETHGAPGVRLRGIGEPIWASRSATELVECERHEALLNLAFADADRFWLLCPYDTEALPPEVIDEARRNHPFVAQGEVREHSADYRGVEAISSPFALELPEAPRDAAELRFGGTGTLAKLRRFVARRASEAGLDSRREHDLVVAANEIASNSLRHGGGSGLLRIWREAGEILCEIRCSGRLADPLADRRPPGPDTPGGRGLWLANQLCDLVQVRTLPGEMVVRLHFALD